MSATELSARKYQKKTSTIRAPYHYVGAGLPNVYLVGVEYRVEKVTGEQSADIPCLPALLDALAKALVEKHAPLTADELRFLRKRMKFASKEFAPVVGLSAEQYSRIENGSAVITPMLDRMVRLIYAAVSKFQPEVTEGVALAKWQAEMTREQSIVASQDEERHWVVRTKAA
jgi:DNA-binding transcriptional regulator YiaG